MGLWHVQQSSESILDNLSRVSCSLLYRGLFHALAVLFEVQHSPQRNIIDKLWGHSAGNCAPSKLLQLQISVESAPLQSHSPCLVPHLQSSAQEPVASVQQERTTGIDLSNQP